MISIGWYEFLSHKAVPETMWQLFTWVVAQCSVIGAFVN